MSDDQVQAVKERIDIVDLVNQYVPLKKSGVNHKGLCPFHREKSPSFMVHEERQVFKCFGCGESGDALSFIQKMEGLNFPEALHLLADRVGIKLERRHPDQSSSAERDEKSVLYRINAAAAKLFHRLLVSHPAAEAARAYLSSRKVSQETIDRFLIGFAPESPVLGRWFSQHGIRPNQLKAAGSPERFRQRVMFPLRDPLGNVVGFTGRSLPGGADPKYFNTPETAIFKKSKVLYGLYEGKADIRTRRSAILVEGQMDVILSHQVGLTVAVASSGTALTADHLRILARYAPTVYLAFDADSAGVAATKKVIDLAMTADVHTKVITFPDGIKDAGEAIEQSPAVWQQAVETAQPSLDWLTEAVISQHNSPLDGRAKRSIAKELLPVFRRLADPVEQAHQLGQLAHRLAVPEASLVAVLERLARPGCDFGASEPGGPKGATRTLARRSACWLAPALSPVSVPRRTGCRRTFPGVAGRKTFQNTEGAV